MSPSPRIGAAAVFVVKVLCGVVIVLASLFTVWTVGPSLETRFFPAVSKLTVVEMHDDPAGRAVIMAEFTKLRDCEFLGLAWYRGDPAGGFERVPVILLRQPGDASSPNRPTGTQRAGPWLIGVPSSEIPGNSFARLSHRCHGFWITTTDFYP